MSTAPPTRQAAPKQPVRFALPDGVPGLVRAAALALAVARHCKAGSWAEFVTRLAERDDATMVHLSTLDIDPDDSALVTEHDHVLRLLNVRPLVTVAVCPTCEGWVLTSGTPPTKCKTSAKCTSTAKPIKASIANRAKAEKDSDGLPEDPEA